MNRVSDTDWTGGTQAYSNLEEGASPASIISADFDSAQLGVIGL